jgi:Na+-driven multidrug efflux pump
VGFIVGEVFPHNMVRFFAPHGSPALFSFAPWAMRVMMIFLPLTGFQIVSANFFVVTGRPKTSIFLSMMRQCIALIPCMLIFGKIWGLRGVVAAAPTADAFSLIITSIMITSELKKLKKNAAL